MMTKVAYVISHGRRELSLVCDVADATSSHNTEMSAMLLIHGRVRSDVSTRVAYIMPSNFATSRERV